LDKDRFFDTPTLVEMWRTAPYLYDGRAATMKEALTTYNTNDEHGMTSDLNEQEITDLVEFVLSQ
jgi:cytochrome c peroxidase